MRLLSCYISAFGGLSDYDIDFSSGVTCVLEQNGFGKTTLAAFIKAMFYGMETANKRTATVENNERTRYYPWNNANFGGHLVFSLGSNTYRIIRYFDRESAARDSFKLVDAESGIESRDYSEKIGLEIFGVDEDGFKRSVFSNGEPCLDALPASVRSKISNIVDSADDFDNFDKALKKLTDAKKELDSKSGEIAKCERLIEESKRQVERCKRDDEEFLRLNKKTQELQKQSADLKAELAVLSQRYEIAANKKADAIMLEQYEKNKAEIAEIKKQIEGLEQKYGGSMPNENDALKLDELLDSYSQTNLLLTEETGRLLKEEYQSLEKLFSDSFPSDEELLSASRALRNADILTNKLGELNYKEAELKNRAEVSGVNLSREISDDELSRIRLLSAKKEAAVGGKTNFALLYILSIAALAAGVGFSFVNLIAGIVVSAVGAVLLIAVILLSSVKKMLGAGSQSEGERETVNAFLRDFGFASDADVNLAVDKVKGAIATAKELVCTGRQAAESAEQIEAFYKEVDVLLSRYISSYENRTEALEALKNACNRYINEVLPTADKKRALEKQSQSLKDNIVAILDSMGVPSTEKIEDSINTLKADLLKHKQLDLGLKKAEKEAEESFNKNKLNDISIEDEFETTEQISLKKQGIEDVLKGINTELAQYGQAMLPLANAKSEMNELSELIDSEREKREMLVHRSLVLEKTIELLKTAKNELSKKYAGSISSAFEGYSELFFGEGSADFVMGTDLSLAVNREGIARTANQFSEGQRSVMDVCLRLSLVDALFEKEKPFILLDDPFASLDEQNFEKASRLIKSVSGQTQIIYFTCHSSRKI